MRIIVLLILSSIVIFFSGCGSADSNTAANGRVDNANSITNVNANNLPPGLSTGPIAPSSNSTPGIPAPGNAVNAMPKGTTPTPGIPDLKNANKIKPGVTPTPGIPSPEEMKRMQQRTSNMNAPPPPPPGAGDGMMMKRKKPQPSNSNN